jgi:hypothetical protein
MQSIDTLSFQNKQDDNNNSSLIKQVLTKYATKIFKRNK